MEVFTPMHYLGKTPPKMEQLDEENSGGHVIGLFANIEGIAIIVVKIFADIKRWDVIDEYLTYDIGNTDICEKKIKEFESKYNVKHFLGNNIGSSIAKKSGKRNNSGNIFEGWETIQLEYEHMLFLVQSNIKNIGFKKEIQKFWSDDLKNFDLKRVRNNEKSYPRIYALACVIEGAKPSFNWLLIT